MVDVQSGWGNRVLWAHSSWKYRFWSYLSLRWRGIQETSDDRDGYCGHWELSLFVWSWYRETCPLMASIGNL